MLCFCFFITQKYFHLPFHPYCDIYHVCSTPLSFIAQQIIHFLSHSIHMIFRMLPFCNYCSKPLADGLRAQLSHSWNDSLVRNIFRIKTKSTTAFKFIKGRVSHTIISYSASQKPIWDPVGSFHKAFVELSVYKCDFFLSVIYDISMISIWCDRVPSAKLIFSWFVSSFPTFLFLA